MFAGRVAQGDIINGAKLGLNKDISGKHTALDPEQSKMLMCSFLFSLSYFIPASILFAESGQEWSVFFEKHER